MNVAVLSDIHGFSLALDAVLDDIDQREVDEMVVAGDLVEGGPGPADVIDALRRRGARCVYGNTDRDVLAGPDGDRSLAAWVRDQIGAAGMDFLRTLPFSIRIPHPDGNGDPSTDLLVVHANPVDVDRHLSPNASDREILEIIGEEPAGTIAFGHLHVAYVRTVGGKTLVDVSATGNPRDGDLRPRYVMFSAAPGGAWSHAYHYVDYPLEETRNQMEASGMPRWKKAYDRLVAARYDRPV
jgi:predicted phosphodiesterase